MASTNVASDKIKRIIMIDSLKTGLWLTPARLKTYPLLLLLMVCGAAAFLVLTRHGDFDQFGRPLGPDFSDIWVAGQNVRDGQPAAAYDPILHQKKTAEFFGVSPDFYLWSYPPYFLGVAALFACFPYLLALLIWQAATLSLYLAAVWAAAKPTGLSKVSVLIPALAFPAVFVNLAHGQNGFLTAALLTGGLLNLERRPLLAGALLACLAYKPQFTVMIPVALIAAGYWRAILSGTLTLCLLTLATVAAFGPGIWTRFMSGLRLSETAVLENGWAGFAKIQSVFAAARLVGLPIQAAFCLQALASVIAAAGIAWLWRSASDLRLKGAALLASILIATPYWLDYDMVVLAPALALATSYSYENGFRTFEKTLFAFVWILPLVARPLATTVSVPLGALFTILFFTLIIWRARTDSAIALKPGFEHPISDAHFR